MPDVQSDARSLQLPASELTDLVCPEGLAPTSARLDWARRVLVHYNGEAAAQWPLLDRSLAGAQIVSAWRGGDLALAARQAQAGGERLARVDALWPRLLQALLVNRPALRRAEAARTWLVETGEQGTAVLTELTLDKGRVKALQRHRLDAPWPQQLLSLHQDDQSGAQGRPVVAAWVHGAGAAAAQQALVAADLDAQGHDTLPTKQRRAVGPDFIRPAPRPSALAWAALAMGGVMLASTVWVTAQAWQQRQAAQTVVSPAPGQMNSSATTATAARKSRGPANGPLAPAVAQRLNHPWRDVFLAAEKPAVAGLNWLVLEHQAGSDLRLQGLARTPELVQRAAGALRAQPPWQRVLVARLDAEGEQLSFELTARGPTWTP